MPGRAAASGPRSVKLGPVPILVRQYVSAFHLCAAAEFARQALALELSTEGVAGIPLRFRHYGAVIGSLVESASFLESTVNELLQDAKEGESTRMGEKAGRLAAYWIAGRRRGTLQKYRDVLTILEAAPLDRSLLGRAEDLVTLRNTLHHYVPETVTIGAPYTNPIFERLKALALNPWAAENAIPLDRLLCHACAGWGVDTAISFVTAFAEAVDVPALAPRVSPCDLSPR
jgi:hypothetical protein